MIRSELNSLLKKMRTYLFQQSPHQRIAHFADLFRLGFAVHKHSAKYRGNGHEVAHSDGHARVFHIGMHYRGLTRGVCTVLQIRGSMSVRGNGSNLEEDEPFSSSSFSPPHRLSIDTRLHLSQSTSLSESSQSIFCTPFNASFHCRQFAVAFAQPSEFPRIDQQRGRVASVHRLRPAHPRRATHLHSAGRFFL